jgi:lipoate-protein ligase A
MAGPGCLFYALLLSLVARPELRMIDCAHRYVMSNMVKGLRALVPGIDFSGTCDLVVGDRKVSGNSVRIGRDWMLYHGTFLLDMDLAALDRWLKHPPREPEYRAHRTHSQFVANLHLSAADVKSALKSNWQAQETDWEIPRDKIKRLVADKYSQATWNYQR